MSRLKVNVDVPETIRAGYDCPCGCHPEIAYKHGAGVANEGCCCGNQFVVGPGTSGQLIPQDGFATEVERFEAPWGEELEAAWAIGPSRH